MSNWALIYPTGTTNLLFNPSVENNLNGWTSHSCTIARTTDKQSRGSYGVAITPTSNVANPGLVSTGTVLTSGTVHSFSADVWIPAGKFIIVGFFDTSNNLLSYTSYEGIGDWERVSNTYTGTATATRRVGVRSADLLNGITFYADGFQLELGPQTSYADGDTEDCYWNGARHNSTSTRPNTSSLGGIEKDLEDDYGIKITDQNGIGMPTIDNLGSDLALQPGAFYQGYSVPERLLNLLGVFVADSPTDLHSKRQAFINAVKPGKKYILKYKQPSRALFLKVVYDAGLGFGKTKGNTERVALRFIAYEPFWYEEFQQGSTLTPQKTITNANALLQRDSDGTWHGLSTGVSNTPFNAGQVYAFARGLDNTLYLAGNFGVPGYTFSNNIARYKDGVLQGMGTGTSILERLEVLQTLPNGKIAIGGEYASIGGKTNTRNIALFNPDTDSYESIYTGVTTGSIVAMAIDGDGNLVVGGNVSRIGSVTVTNIAKYDFSTSTWSSLGNPGAKVNAIALGPDGNLYVGLAGTVTSIVKKYVNGSWETIGTATISMNVEDIAFDSAGLLYAVGYFTGTALGGNYFGIYNGNIWVAPTAIGPNSFGYSVTTNPVRNTVLIGGLFTQADNLTLPDAVAEFNGSAFTAIDADLPAVSIVNAIDIANDGAMTLGYSFTGTAITSEVTTLHSRATAPVFPVFEFFVSGTATATRLYQIRNEDSNQTIYLNLTIQPGETIIIDLSKKTIASSYRGKIFSKVIKGSNFANWNMDRSTNRISMFADKASLACKVYWTVQHFSADGSS
jgi:hypothetical protein